MLDEVKAKAFHLLKDLEAFKAQTSLEDETYLAWSNKLLSIDLKSDSVDLEYAKCRGALEVLKALKANRDRLIEQARRDKSNS